MAESTRLFLQVNPDYRIQRNMARVPISPRSSMPRPISGNSDGQDIQDNFSFRLLKMKAFPPVHRVYPCYYLREFTKILVNLSQK
jgi:hypothetical protein